MKFKNPLLVVTDMDRSVAFYEKVLGLRVIMDFGANKTLTGGVCLQTVATWKAFIGTGDVSFGSNNAEVYFEEDDFQYYLDKNNGNVNATIYEMLIIKSEDSTISVSGLSTQDTSAYFKRLASRFKPFNSGILNE